jgi:hypothetical protein
MDNADDLEVFHDGSFREAYKDARSELTDGSAGNELLQSASRSYDSGREQINAGKQKVAAAFVPTKVGGRVVTVPLTAYQSQYENSLTVTLDGVLETHYPLLVAADHLRALAAGAVGLTDPGAAQQVATAMALGPLSIEPGMGPQYAYLVTLLQQLSVSPTVMGHIEELLGLPSNDISGIDESDGMGWAIASMLETLRPSALWQQDLASVGMTDGGLGSSSDTASSEWGSDEASYMSMPTDEYGVCRPTDVEAAPAEMMGEKDSDLTSRAIAANPPKAIDFSINPLAQTARPKEEEPKVEVKPEITAGRTTTPKAKINAGTGGKYGAGLDLKTTNVQADGAATTVATGAAAGAKADGSTYAALNLAAGKADADGNGFMAKTSITAENGNVGGEKGLDVTKKLENGDERTRGGSFALNSAGEATAKASQTTKRADGTASSTTGSVAHGKGTTTLAAGTAELDKDGNTTKGASAAASMTNKNGEKGGTAAVSATRNGATASGSAALKVTTSKPKKVDGKWVVTFETAASAGLGGGYAKKKGRNGAGANASVNGHTESGGTRIFDTEKEALAFHKKGVMPSFGMPDSVEAALALREGETLSSGSGIGGSAGVDGNVGAVQAGASVVADRSTFAKVTRGAGGCVRVEVGDSALNGWEAHGGAAGVSLGYGESSATNESRTVEFDLETEVGQTAYKAYRKSGELPAKGNGWRLVGTHTGRADNETFKLSALGASFSNTSTVGHSVTMNGDEKQERDWGSEGMSLSVPLLGKHAESHSLQMLQINDKHTSYTMESMVKAESIGAAAGGMSGMTGFSQKGSTRGETKGEYRLQASVSEAQMDKFIGLIKRNGGSDKGTSYYAALADADELRSLLKKAGSNKDKQRVALAEWVSEEGEDALALIRNVTHGKGTNFFVEIPGDAYLTGIKGQVDQELRIAAWRQRMDEGDGGLSMANEVRVDLAHQRDKHDHLADYTELPRNVWNNEKSRTVQNITMLEVLMDRALLNASSADAAVEGQSSVAQAHRLLGQSRTLMYTAYASAYRYQRMHEDGLGRGMSLGPFHSARESLTDEKGMYEAAKKATATASFSESKAKPQRPLPTVSSLQRPSATQPPC